MTEQDPDKLERVDHEIRINELKERANELAGGQMHSFSAEDMPPEVEEAFWQQVMDYESSPLTTCRKQLEADGVSLPPPEELTDTQLPAKLTEMFEHMARHNCYVVSTNHLSDRQLYENLWRDTLNEEFVAPPAGSSGAYIIDLVSSGSEEDIQAYLRYYADEETRAKWAKDFPSTPPPPHEDMPYDRDRNLPRMTGPGWE